MQLCDVGWLGLDEKVLVILVKYLREEVVVGNLKLRCGDLVGPEPLLTYY